MTARGVCWPKSRLAGDVGGRVLADAPVDQNLVKSYDGLEVQKILRVLISVGFAIYSLSLSACDGRGRHSTQNAPSHKPILSAQPNPIPAGDPDQALATTQITWHTGDETTGDLYVKIDRADEVFIAHAPSGTMKIDWIQFDSRYEFRLYAKKRSKLLAKLEVTRDD
jgi:hypothetical protein